MKIKGRSTITLTSLRLHCLQTSNSASIPRNIHPRVARILTRTIQWNSHLRAIILRVGLHEIMHRGSTQGLFHISEQTEDLQQQALVINKGIKTEREEPRASSTPAQQAANPLGVHMKQLNFFSGNISAKSRSPINSIL
jgi:hypothetical protein